MPKITLTEVDNTSPVAEALSEDIVFVPGFAYRTINTNVYIEDVAPTTSTIGTVFQDGDTVDTPRAVGVAPSLYYNSTDKKSYKCTAIDGDDTKTYTWTELTEDEKITPHTESTEPVLCYSVEEFEKAFGKTPYVFADGTIDLSYLMAKEYLTLGLPVAYSAMNTHGASVATPADVSNGITAVLSDIADPGYIYVRYLTNGAYPVYATSETTINDNVKAYLDCAKSRQDAYVILDHEKTSEIDYSAWMTKLRTAFAGNESGSRASLFTPWATYSITNLGSKELTGDFILPASFGYIVCLAKSITANNPAYMAVSGVARGRCPFIKNLYVANRLSNKIANETLQSDTEISVNPITEIKPYGLTIWGNNTLADNKTAGGRSATSYLNIRNLVCRVMKLLRDAATRIIFEPNTDALWVTFKGLVMPTLDAMVSGQGLKKYNIVRQPSSDNTEVKAKIYLVPMYAVEKVTLEVVLTNDGTVELVGGNA